MSVATIGLDVSPELGQVKQELLDARERARRRIEAWLAAEAGRALGDLQLVCPVLTIVGDTEEEREAWRRRARGRLRGGRATCGEGAQQRQR